MQDKEKFQDFIYVDEKDLNLRQLIEKYLFYWKWFAVSIIIALIGAFIYLRYTPKSYEVTATILIDDEASGGLPTELAAFEELGFGASKKNIENEMGILMSRSLMTRVVKKLDLNITYFKEGNVTDAEIYQDQVPFKASFNVKDSVFFERSKTFKIKIISNTTFELSQAKEAPGVSCQYYKKVKIEEGEVIILPNNIKPTDINSVYIVNISPIKTVVNNYRQNVEVSLLYKKANIIELKLSGPVKKKTEDILNELIRQYNKDAIEYKSLIGNNTNDFINERLDLIQENLVKVDKTAENFKITNKLTDIPLETEIVLENSSKIEKEIVDLSTQLKLVDYMLEQIQSNSDNLIPENLGIKSTEVNSVSSQYNQILLERNRISKSSGKINPLLLNLNEQISQLRSSIKQSLVNLKRSLSVSLSEAKSRERSINNRITSAPGKEREFKDIQRQQAIIETLYLFLLQKREENAISLAVTVSNAKLIDAAEGSDKPVGPRRKMVYGLALLLGLVVPFIILYIFMLLDNKIRSQKELEELLKAPIIGDIPEALDENKILKRSDRGNIAEAFRMLRTNMRFILGSLNKESNIIYVTSTMPNEGKTFITINLASVLAMSDKKVLVIGADIRKPKLGQYLDVSSNSKGLTEFMADRTIKIDDIIVFHETNGFALIQAGIQPPNPSELFMNGRFKEVLDYGKKHYDYVIVDTPPINMVTDTLQIASQADMFIYVVRANYLDKRLLEIPKKLFDEKRLPNMSVVMNGTNTKKGYGYAYGYGSGVEKKSWFKRIIKS